MSNSTHHHHHHHKKSRRSITVSIQPTLGKPFAISCSPQLTVENLKEDISDRLGISPKKMSVLFQSKELTEGTLLENSIEDGSDLRLVPTLESGTSISMDPMAMMKHSMSGISDQQIDEFLAGKSPLSVAIRLGESVVVVNLNRAKVEEVDVDSPPPVKHCSRSHSRRTSDDISTAHPPAPSSATTTTTTMLPAAAGVSTAPLNTNPHWSSPSSSLSTVAPPCSTATPSIGSRHPTQTLSATPAPAPSIPTPSSSTLPPPEQPCVHRHVPKREPSKSSRSKAGSKVQLTQEQWEELRRLQETPVSESGISMKRKAVMEAIGEILKKMYTQRAKGKIPGSFKGRFSSEFTCDGDMREIIHSRTTMTSYGDSETASGSGVRGRESAGSGSSDKPLTQSRFEENETLRDKVAMLKWKMQQGRAERKAKRKRSDKPSPCGWMEAIDCDISAPPPKIRRKTGVCGFKRGFLLAD